MRQSELFTKTRKEAPADEIAKNARLLIRAGFIEKEMAGVYDYLPLGLKVLKKIENIIREEMEAIGGQEVLMTTLQDPDLWKKSGRWEESVVDNWFKTELLTGGKLGIANTHEEPVTVMLTHFVKSYKDLPVYVYQFQNKFRNELRAKSGIMRSREFLMKDMYSFSRSENEFRNFYESCAKAYSKIFDRVGLGHLTYRTVAGGGSFTAGLTDEFQTVCDAGEDIIYVDKAKKIAINKEVLTEENLSKFGLQKSDLEEKKAIEVGNIFPLGTKYTDVLGLSVSGEKGEPVPVIMGSYGIGLGRLFGTIVEALSDDKGIVWPQPVAPFGVHLVRLGVADSVVASADNLYEKLKKNGVEVLYDDRDMHAGEKFGDCDLMGIPMRFVVSEKTGDKVEIKKRTEAESKLVSVDEALKAI